MNRAPLAASVLVTLALIGCNIRFGGMPAIQGSGKRASEPRQTGEFGGISLEGSADVDVKIGDETSVVVEGDDNLLRLITTEVKNGTLVIANRESYSTRIGIHVHITTPKLQFASIPGSGSLSTGGIEAITFDASIPGSGRMIVEGLRTEKLDASLSGSGEVEISNLRTNTFVASLVGSGSIKIAGSAETVDASLPGSGNMDLDDLAANNVSVSISGSGNADVRASGKLTANISGAGNVNYSGNPTSVVKDISGPGGVQAQ